MAASNVKSVRRKMPLADRVAAEIEARITAGEFNQGAILPARSKLAREYDVAIETMQQAIGKLVSRGLLRSENGRGTFVNGEGQPVPSVIDLPGRAGAFPFVEYRNYKPALGKVGIICRIGPWHRSSEFRTLPSRVILESVERAISKLDGSSLVYNLHHEDGSLCGAYEAFDYLAGHETNAAIWIAGEYDEVVDTAISAGLPKQLPTVFTFEDEAPTSLSYAFYSSREAGQGAAEHLIKQGCRKLVAFSPYDLAWARNRVEGVRQALTLSGASSTSLEVCTGSYTDTPSVAHAEEFATHILNNGITFDGVIGINDLAAFGFMAAASKIRNLEPGRDYNLIGFDDYDGAREKGLTTMRPPVAAMGEGAVQLLQQLALQQRVSSIVSPRRVGYHSDLVQRLTTPAR